MYRIKTMFFIFSFCAVLYVPSGSVGFCYVENKACRDDVSCYAHKKSVALFRFIGVFEVFDYLIPPNYNE